MVLLLTNDDESISLTLLVVGRSIGNAKRVGNGVSGKPDQIDIACPSMVRYQLIMFNSERVRKGRDEWEGWKKCACLTQVTKRHK